jgi:hypothetical protein
MLQWLQKTAHDRRIKTPRHRISNDIPTTVPTHGLQDFFWETGTHNRFLQLFIPFHPIPFHSMHTFHAYSYPIHSIYVARFHLGGSPMSLRMSPSLKDALPLITPGPSAPCTPFSRHSKRVGPRTPSRGIEDLRKAWGCRRALRRRGDPRSSSDQRRREESLLAETRRKGRQGWRQRP